MLQYVTKRILWAITTIFVVMVLVFFLSKYAPNDPVLAVTKSNDQAQSDKSDMQLYKKTAVQLGLDKPVFYFDIASKNQPDTLYKILSKRERQTVKKLLAVPLDWRLLQNFRKVITENLKATNTLTKNDYLLLLDMDDTVQISTHISNMMSTYDDENLKKIKSLQLILFLKKLKSTDLFPSFRWYGYDNEFHFWISNFLKGKFGNSYLDGRSVSAKIWEAFRLTFWMNLFVLLISYGLAIPFSIYLASIHTSRFNKFIQSLMFVIHSIPLFLIATFTVIFFTNNYYHLKFFPNIGLSNTEVFSIENIPNFILPILCIAIPYIVHITIPLYISMVNEIEKNYAVFAISKGISKKDLISNHVFKNAIFPLIQMISGVLPFLFVGSFIVELIFNLPGMGQLIYTSLLYQDWPIVFAAIAIIGILIVLGNIIADILLTFADPRIKLD
jgi:peptide/nickel transport system permease protein